GDQPPGGGLAAAGLAHHAEGLPLEHLEADPVDRLDGADLPFEQARRDGEVLLHVVHGKKRLVLAHCVSRTGLISFSHSARRSVLGMWQRTRWPRSVGARSGTSVEARPSVRSAYGQRGWKAQPGGTLMSDGGEPLIGSSRSVGSRSSRGIEPSRPQV